MKQFKTEDNIQACCERTDAYQGFIRFLNYSARTIYQMHKNRDTYHKRVKQMANRLQRSYGGAIV